MKASNLLFFAVALLTPMICTAGEPSKGTVIMISSVSGWLLLSSGFILLREIKRSRRKNDQD